jgi:hypothetical protein
MPGPLTQTLPAWRVRAVVSAGGGGGLIKNGRFKSIKIKPIPDLLTKVQKIKMINT